MRNIQVKNSVRIWRTRPVFRKIVCFQCSKTSHRKECEATSNLQAKLTALKTESTNVAKELTKEKAKIKEKTGKVTELEKKVTELKELLDKEKNV